MQRQWQQLHAAAAALLVRCRLLLCAAVVAVGRQGGSGWLMWCGPVCCTVCVPACPQVNLLPVVEEDGSVVGIVTRHDILRGIYASKNPLL